MIRFDGVRFPLTGFDLVVDLAIGGGVTTIVGPSGSGKTTLLEILAGLRAPAEGKVSIGDRVVFDRTNGIEVVARERGIGYLTQDDTLFPHLGVERNLGYGAMDGGRGRIEEVATKLRIDHLLGRSVKDLSGGERRRVALGRAVLAAKSVLLLDEPLTGLNSELRGAATELIAAFQAESGIPVVYVTHVPEEAAPIADEVVELREGSVVAKPGDNLRGQPLS